LDQKVAAGARKQAPGKLTAAQEAQAAKIADKFNRVQAVRIGE